jgi:hypothetical protein
MDISAAFRFHDSLAESGCPNQLVIRELRTSKTQLKTILLEITVFRKAYASVNTGTTYIQ